MVMRSDVEYNNYTICDSLVMSMRHEVKSTDPFYFNKSHCCWISNYCQLFTNVELNYVLIVIEERRSSKWLVQLLFHKNHSVSLTRKTIVMFVALSFELHWKKVMKTYWPTVNEFQTTVDNASWKKSSINSDLEFNQCLCGMNCRYWDLDFAF